jgi:dTMP kinase
MEDIEDWIKALREASKEKIILVEGIKDKRALTSLGVKNIVILKGRALFEVVEGVVKSGKECIILFDLDKKGRELFGRINSRLQHFGVKVDNRFREFLFKETKLRQIEGILHYLKTIEA